MSAWVVEVTVVALFALTSGALAVAWMRGRLGVASLVLFGLALLVWVLAFLAITQEFHGANNFATCGDDCGAIHYLSAVAFISPPLLISLAALAMLVSRGLRWRARRTPAHENHA